jgi:hypothetical protein
VALSMATWFRGVGTIFLLLGLIGSLSAQEAERAFEQSAVPPIAVVNFAGVERLLDDVDYLFGSVKRNDLIEVVEGLLGNVGDLRGLERGRPFGVMVFLRPGLVPQPVPVGYLPVSDAAALARTVEIGPVTTRKISEDRYEIVGRRQTLFARMIGDYAFVANEEDLLEREFPVPTEAYASLTTRYDFSIDIRPENMPPGMRDLFVNLLRTNAQAQLQRRDNESEVAYAFRKSQGMQNLQLIESLLKETRSITLGLDASRESRKAVLELVIVAKEGTPYLQQLQGLADEASRFTAIIDDEVPLSFSVNSKIDEQTRKAHAELLNAGERRVAQIVTRLERPRGEEGERPRGSEPDPSAAALAERIFAPLKSVNERGSLDAFAQFRGDPEKKFVALAGMVLPGAADMEAPVRELIDRVRAARPDIASGFEVQYGVAEAGGVSLHRLTPREIRERDRRFWGDTPGLYVGFDQNTVWLALGGTAAVPALDEAITRVKNADLATRNQPGAPFKLVVTANRWVGLGPDRANTELAREAFSEGRDTLRIDFRPTDTGGRLRIEAEEGFIRLLGLGVSRRYDESQL